ncbi:MAG: hypothetical protein A3H57_04930 [Candidatus Taylorbacteria bacterium RIFCSPLOWO2_02_FULL_43_11]|uniref:Uncharacterized protein n=1 Tax=Candidatus Taylorbacteria bacterium RIFCSPHIGHO2_02_FULL_43_32b TaxID=1802306 RepID=A0A1G2MLS1_9BACT|nr:MAG: hypothetical protein A2743_03390 [Candidatus Taylorbacteria bacterium RIFCSPHIGHO2_01_FULL_43_47]OHA24159.1 MAG: hypothetical protein A3C72_03800 [Candidatus Taylorbacteria bacterium RIFCSPHIGHO2_02_FULL_43_32b]OHA31072.1 MAG: hypothetical protein A3B08_01355 [Candidatus Taylorbacteria bacterium RIFCSPLOWO2_01_FULL_43_44]OHA37222.1 MAG: hypothetical protein A3H57_04930 [Candidatus Taylorbacteria bacterium RIFCSPLOWO2_02_FULL_43_11]
MKYPVSEYAKYLLSLRKLPRDEQKESLNKFVKTLQKNGDIKEWQRIADVYESIDEKQSKTKKATIRYLGEISKAAIQSALPNYEIEFVEDRKTLGGITIRVGDLRIDNTITGRLAEVKRALM